MLVSRRGLAQQAERHVEVKLAEGVTRRFDDAISDFEAVSYVVSLETGQSLQIALETNHAANCFDIHAPGLEKPIYVGADAGVSHRLVAPAAGDYAIRVFLLRFAARDGQSAQYSLELTLGA